MKKTLLSVLAGLVVIGTATAVPSMDVQQKNCEDGQHVWVEKTKTCVPINPCLSDDADIKRAYCDDKTFANISLSNLPAGIVVGLVPLYRKCLLGEELPAAFPVRYPTLAEPNYFAEHLVGAGMYKVYKFANLDVNRSSAMEYLNGVCNAIGGADTGRTFYNNAGFASIECKSTCPGTYDLLTQIMNWEFDYDIDYVGNKITISFKSEQGCYSFDDCIKR